MATVPAPHVTNVLYFFPVYEDGMPPLSFVDLRVLAAGLTEGTPMLVRLDSHHAVTLDHFVESEVGHSTEHP